MSRSTNLGRWCKMGWSEYFPVTEKLVGMLGRGGRPNRGRRRERESLVVCVCLVVLNENEI